MHIRIRQQRGKARQIRSSSPPSSVLGLAGELLCISEPRSNGYRLIGSALLSGWSWNQIKAESLYFFFFRTATSNNFVEEKKRRGMEGTKKWKLCRENTRLRERNLSLTYCIYGFKAVKLTPGVRCPAAHCLHGKLTRQRPYTEDVSKTRRGGGP